MASPTPLCNSLYFILIQDEQLRWRGPPTRQLTRQRRIEYESDIRERFYDDYIGERRSKSTISSCPEHLLVMSNCAYTSMYVHAAGDAGNAVETNLAKKRYHPDYYRVNAYQGLIYDPMRKLMSSLVTASRITIINTNP